MRILAITNLYPRPKRPTIAAFNRQQFAALACVHELHVLVAQPWFTRLGDWFRLPPLAPIDQKAAGPAVTYQSYFYVPKILRRQQGQFFVRSLRRTILRVADKVHPDVLLGCWAYPDGWATVKIARELGLPAVVKVHGSDVLVAGRDPARRHLVTEALCEADGVVAVSQDLGETVVNRGVSRQNVHVVPNGIDLQLFNPGDRARSRARLDLPVNQQTILFVGNLLVSKGTALLIEACRILRDQQFETPQRAFPTETEFCRECPPWHSAQNPGAPGGGGRNATAPTKRGYPVPYRAAPPFHCYLVGSGRDERKLRSLIGKHGLRDYVTLAGSCPHDRLADWYRAADVVSLPSYSEGIPNVLLEAIGCGTPYVATRVGGIPEISHASYSRLVERGDARALATALHEVLRSPMEVDPAFVRERNISWQQSAERLATVLQAAVDGRASQPLTEDILSA